MLRYLGVVLGMLLTLVVGAGSLYLAWPWVMSEHMRLTHLELALTLLAEVGALLWFLYFLGKFMVTSELDSAFDEDMAHAPGTQLIAGLVILAAAIDLGATFYFEAQAKAARKTAVDGVCRIDKVKLYSLETTTDRRGDAVGEVFCALTWCNIVGTEGKATPTYYYGKSSRFPDSVHEAITRDRLPAEMEVTYEAKFPRKFWITGIADDNLNVWRLSQEITISALVFTLLMLAVNKALFDTAIPLEICPLLGIILRLAFAGVYMFFHDQTGIPPM